MATFLILFIVSKKPRLVGIGVAISGSESIIARMKQAVEAFQQETELLALQEAVRVLDPSHIGLDMDQTLVNTETVFILAYHQAAQALYAAVRGTSITFAEVKQNLSQATGALAPTFNVAPPIVEAAVQATAESMGIADLSAIERAQACMRAIYTPELTPRALAGATETLELLARCNVKLLLMSHATGLWTKLKLEANNWTQFFSEEQIVDFHVYRPKAEQIAEALTARDIDPARFLIVEDNWKAGARPVLMLGGRAILVPGLRSSPSTDEVEPFIAQGKLVLAKSIATVPQAIIDLKNRQFNG